MEIVNVIIKQLSIAVVSCIFFFKIRPLNLVFWKKALLSAGFIILTLSAFVPLTNFNVVAEPYKTAIVIVTVSIFLAVFLKERIEKMVTAFVIVYALSYVVFTFAICISYFILLPFVTSDVSADGLRFTVTAIISIFTASLLLRLKVDFSPIFKKFASGIFLSISSMVIILYGLSRVEMSVSYERFFLLTVGFVMLGYGIYSWLRRETTISKSENAKDVLFQKQQDILAQKEQDISVLRNISAYLTSNVHEKDKSLDGMKRAVEKVIMRSAQMDVLDDAKILLDEIELSRDRDDKKYNQKLLDGAILQQTGILIADGKFEAVLERAMLNSVDFNLVVNGDVSGFGKIIPQFDLANIIGDLTENAFIAIKHLGKEQPFHKIQFTIAKTDDGYELCCEDSGIPFDIDTLLKLGVERVTSHSDDGGSGCGYETIFKLLNEYSASLIITEFEQIPYTFSKEIAIRFDGKADYIVKSFRADKIKEQNNNTSLNVQDLKEKVLA